MRWIERFAAVMLLSTTVTGAWAQNATPPAGQEPDENEAPVKVRWFSLGYYGWAETGNGHKLRQYATPSRGFQIGELRLVAPANGKSPYSTLILRGSPDGDRIATGAVSFADGRGMAKATVSRHEFYDPTPMVIPASSEDVAEATVQYAISPDIGVFYRFKQRTRDMSFEAPKDPTYYRTKSRAGGIEGKVMGGHLGVTVADNRFYDKTGSQPNSIQHRIDARYSVAPIPALNIEGMYAQTRIEQVGRVDGEVNSWAVAADLDMGPSTALLVNVRRDEIDFPIIENAHVRERFLTSARLVHRAGKVAFQAGFLHRESERIRADQQFVDVPSWDTYDAKISGRFAKDIRYSVGWSWEHLTQGPTMLTEDARALYWDDRVRAQVKLSGGGERCNGYATYGLRYDQNSPRETEIRSHNLAFGGSYAVDDKTSAFLEIAGTQYKVNGDDTLVSFFPGSTSFSIGADHALRPNESVSLGVNWFVTDNDNPLGDKDNNVRGTQINASYRRQIDANSSLELTYSPWRYTDRAYDAMNYRTTVVGLTFNTRF